MTKVIREDNKRGEVEERKGIGRTERKQMGKDGERRIIKA